jgi:carboxymethylenebutenolidase
LPVSAEPEATREPLVNQHVQISTGDGNFRAYLARPQAASAPAVVVLHELFGVNADLRATCDELASQGYLALSPDLFWRLEPGIDMSPGDEGAWKKGFELFGAFDLDAGVRDIAETMKAARSLPGATGKVGVMGFCLGGLMTFLITARQGADAAVAYYGGGTEKHLDEASQIESPLLLHLGEQDEYISADARRAITMALQGNPRASVLTYPGCWHAFARHGGVHYDKQAAELANARTAEFFRQHLQ